MPTQLNKPVRRMSNAPAATFGPDRGKRLVVTITPNPSGDLLSLRPEKTQRTETVALSDVYRWAIQCRVNAVSMAKLREKKAKKAAAKAEAKWKRSLKRDYPEVQP